MAPNVLICFPFNKPHKLQGEDLANQFMHICYASVTQYSMQFIFIASNHNQGHLKSLHMNKHQQRNILLGDAGNMGEKLTVCPLQV